MSWGIIGTFRDPMCRFAESQRKSNLELKDLDLPERNTVIFQQLNGRQLTKCPYTIWFAFDNPDPTDVYVRIKLFDPRGKK